jgi:lipid-A-disaccharide synthase-like uncharacterized protein
MDDWRIFLYPLGFIPNVAFGLRFLIQWIQSEKKGQSVVTPLFWYLSILGNVLLALHSIIQLQLPIALFQTTNALLSYRNLSLMQHKPLLFSRNTMIILLLSIPIIVLGIFQLHDILTGYHGTWTRIPIAPWQLSKTAPISFWWHFFGTLGYILFSTRFFIQWWLSEKEQKSYLPESFWWSSLLGTLLVLAYTFKIGDSVNFIGPFLGSFIYTRNLILIYKRKTTSKIL